MLDLEDTIAALASAPGPAARGILRVSGRDVRPVLGAIFTPDDRAGWETARRSTRFEGGISLPLTSVPVRADVWLWPTGRSYTGQPVAEIHTVGSPPLLEAILAELHAHGARPARPGEFTLRAFLAGRLDLVQAEAVLGVIDAPDHRELELALRQLAGGMSTRVAACRRDLLDLLADLEAGLDFIDEDIEFVSREAVIERLEAALAFLAELFAQSQGRMTTSIAAEVVLAGLPNAGKSSLFNALVRREAAIVSELRGTTRDYLTADLEIEGRALRLIDTAGWEFTDEAIMTHAQALRHERLASADLILWCTAVDRTAEEDAVDAQLVDSLLRENRPVLRVVTKCDLAEIEKSREAGRDGAVRVSVRRPESLAGLERAVAAALEESRRGERQMVGTTAARCRASLEGAARALEDARAQAQSGAGDEMLAIEIRDALDHLGQIVGAVYTDDILDRIFSRFCIGK